jgi:membrane protease YdiL (CAAX protease family)
LAAADIYRKHYAMKSFIRNLSPCAEFCLVILICFGLPIVGIVLGFAGHLAHGTTRQAHFSNRTLAGVLIYEALVLALVFRRIGPIRGWSFGTFGFQISCKWIGAGILLFAVAELFAWLGRAMHPAAMPTGSATGELTVPLIVLFSVANPVFEELMEAGYFIRSLQGFGMWPAVLASAFFRAFLHAHLGIFGAMNILVMGVLFGLVYWKWRQLWPLIAAHSLMDLIGLLYLAHHVA